MFDDGSGTQLLKLIIRIQGSGAELVSRENSGADEHGAVETRGYIDRGLQPYRSDGCERLARDPVVFRIGYNIGKICEPAVIDVATIKIIFRSLQLLAPIGIGITQIFVSV